jgi:hypothetical protein
VSLLDLLKSSPKPTLERLVDELASAEHENNELSVIVQDKSRSLAKALNLIETATVLLHAEHPGPLKTCLRNACVQMRKGRMRVPTT